MTLARKKKTTFSLKQVGGLIRVIPNRVVLKFRQLQRKHKEHIQTSYLQQEYSNNTRTYQRPKKKRKKSKQFKGKSRTPICAFNLKTTKKCATNTNKCKCLGRKHRPSKKMKKEKTKLIPLFPSKRTLIRQAMR